MKVLIAYPNLPMMLIPAVAVGIFTAICKENGVEVRLFETTAYSDDANQGMLYKSKIGAGRSYTPEDLGMELKPTNVMIPDFVNYVEEYNPDIILFSTVEDTFKDTILMLDAIEHLNIPHIVGGVFPIAEPELCINHPSINMICRFEGEYVVRDIIERYRSSQPWNDVRGTWTKEKRNPPQALAVLEETIPDYSLYHPNRFNRAVGGNIVKSINIESYRGCPYSCTFCNSPMTRYLDKHYLRRKSIEHMREELDYYVELYNPDYLFFVDDSFLARPRHEIIDLCELLAEYKIPWWCNTRIENVDEEILKVMKDGYCDRIQFGIECGDEEYRKNILKRNVTDADYNKKIDAINGSGIPYGLNVIIGLPHETREMVFKTVDLVKRFGGYDGIGIGIFIPYRGTELHKYSVENGLLDEKWISSDGYLLGGSALSMADGYLQRDEITELAETFKYYCFFREEKWEIIRNKDVERIYDREFYKKYAGTGNENIEHRKKSIWACEPDEYMDVRVL